MHGRLVSLTSLIFFSLSEPKVQVDDAWLETIQYDHCDDDDNDNDVGPGFIPLNLHVLRLNLQHQVLTS